MDKRIRIAIFIILFSITSLLIPYAMYLKEKNIRSDKELLKEVQGVQDISAYPALAQVPPNTAYVGEPFEYRVEVVDRDTKQEEIEYKLITSPEWMFVEGNRLYGIPSADNPGSAKVVLEISDGSHSIQETFYIVILENEN